MEVVSAPADARTGVEAGHGRTLAESLRCPGCRSIDWYRDGFDVYERPDGSVQRLRTGPIAGAFAPWSCARCGHTVPWRAELHRILSDPQVTHVE
jgi:hypothetical protein